MALKKMCVKNGCSQLIDHGSRYCAQHQPQDHRRYDDYRESAAKRGYGSRWRAARSTYLKRHPLCVECQRTGMLVLATVVDHITAHKGDKKLFWDKSNWQALCARHHNQKTARDDGGFGR